MSSQGDPLLVRQAEEALRAAVGAQRVEQQAEDAVEQEIEPEGGAARRAPASTRERARQLQAISARPAAS